MEQARVLVQILEELRQQNAMLQSAMNTLREQSRQKDEEIERLRQIILNLQRAQFGQRSEKRTYVLDDGNQQLSLFDTPEKSEEKSNPEPSQNPEKEICVSGHSRKKKRTLEELCATLPVEERIVDLPDNEKVNPNGHALTCIGQEYIRTELVLERAKAKVVKHYRKVYADRQLEQETGYSEVFKPVMPPPLLAHSYASASVVTDVLMKKYVDAMPLYRQEQMWKRMGVELKRGTMANWVIQVADLYLRPFWKRILHTPPQEYSMTAEGGALVPREWCIHSGEMVHGGRRRGAPSRHAGAYSGRALRLRMDSPSIWIVYAL